MNAIFRSKSTRMLSALLAVLMIVAMLPTTAFAWSAEEGTKCTSTYGDKYLGSDGDYFYSKPTTTAIFYNDDGSYYVKTYSSGNAKYKYMMIDGSGNYHHVYCIEGGVSFDYSDTYNSTSGKNSKYFQNLPITAQYGIMMALMCGYHEGMTTPVAGTNNDDFAFATQCIIWEYQQQLRTIPSPGETLELGSATVTFLAPIDMSLAETNVNNSSIILRIVYGKTSFLFTGDAEIEEELSLLKAGTDIQSTVLKVGHHGSYTSSSEEFLAAIDPDYAVISVGMGSEYGHPHDAALERISKFCPVIYRTDLNGEVICYSDGLKLIFECGS